MKIVIGTSGYSYEDWRSVFYPEKIKKGEMLNFYAGHFKSVEINSTYYKISHPAVFARMAEKTPQDFEFIVKAHQSTTHARQNIENAAAELKDAIAPLLDEKKFSGFLLQFPYSFKNNLDNRKYLIQTRKLFSDLPLFIEFRHFSWQTEAILPFLKGNNFAFVNVDQPRLKGLLYASDWITGDLSYVRFHGRNTEMWWKGDNASRYDYAYTENELNDWVIRISHLLKKTSKTYIFFNNHPQGKAIQAAKMMQSLLEKQLNLFANLS